MRAYRGTGEGVVAMTDGSGLVRYVALDVAASVETLSPAEARAAELIQQKVAAQSSLQDVVDFVFDVTADVSPCDRIGLALLEDDGHRIVAHYARASYEPLLLKPGYAEDLGQGSLGTVLRKRGMRIIDDLERYLAGRPDSASTKLLVREGVRSSLTCPLRVDDRVVGVLFRSSRKSQAYAEHHVRLHQVVAERISQAVEKTVQIQRLQAAHEAYFGTLAFVTHELRSPVASMIMDASLLRDGVLGAVEPRQRERIEHVIAKGQYLLNLIQEYLDLARIEGGDMKPNVGRVRLRSAVLDPALAIVQPQFDERRMQLAVHAPEPDGEVELDAELIKIVVVNLLGNAAKYGIDEGQVRLDASIEPDRVRVAVWNQGPGFPPSERSRLFRRFSRVRSDALMKVKGSGIGLYTSWRIVRAHGGRLDARSKEGEWAEFSFEIAQPPRIAPIDDADAGRNEDRHASGSMR